MEARLPDTIAWPALAVVVAVCLCTAAAHGAPAAPEAAECATAPVHEETSVDVQKLSPELRMVLDHLDEANKDLQDITARIVYERSIPLFEEKERSRGSLIFKKPDLISLELGKPRREEIHTDGKTWWVVSHVDKQVEIYAALPEGDTSAESAFLDLGYGRESSKLLKEYSIAILDKKVRDEPDDRPETVYVLRFTPRPKTDARPARYAHVDVDISDRTWLPQRFVLHESGGKIIHTYTLSKVRLNTKVKDKQFDYKPPRGYSVLRPLDS